MSVAEWGRASAITGKAEVLNIACSSALTIGLAFLEGWILSLQMNVWREGVKETQSGSIQPLSHKATWGNGHKQKYTKSWLNMKSSFYCDSDKNLELVQWGYEIILFGNTQKLPGYGLDKLIFGAEYIAFDFG